VASTAAVPSDAIAGSVAPRRCRSSPPLRTVELLEFFSGHRGLHSYPNCSNLGYPKSSLVHALAHADRPRLGVDRPYRHALRSALPRAAGWERPIWAVTHPFLGQGTPGLAVRDAHGNVHLAPLEGTDVSTWPPWSRSQLPAADLALGGPTLPGHTTSLAKRCCRALGHGGARDAA